MVHGRLEVERRTGVTKAGKQGYVIPEGSYDLDDRNMESCKSFMIEFNGGKVNAFWDDLK